MLLYETLGFTPAPALRCQPRERSKARSPRCALGIHPSNTAPRGLPAFLFSPHIFARLYFCLQAAAVAGLMRASLAPAPATGSGCTTAAGSAVRCIFASKKHTC